MNQKLLADGIPLGNFEPPVGNWVPTANAANQFENILSIIIGIMTVVGGIYFIFVFITAAFEWMTAGGDKNKLQRAQQRMLQGVIGLVIIVSAYAIVSLISFVLGFDILNPAAIVNNLWGGEPAP